MRIQLLLAIYILCINTARAQEVKQYPVKAGEIPAAMLPREAMYVLPAFTAGTASLKDGTSSTQRFNYNFLLDEMHFIGEKGDTLAIADPAIIRSVVIDSMSFYYDNGYVREILKQGGYKLAVKQEMVQTADKKRGGYDMPTATGSIQTYGTVGSNSQMYHLEVKKDVLFHSVTSFYVANMSNHFLKANKKSFYTLFGEAKTAKYLKDNKIDFNKEEDLKGLLRYCAQ